MRKSPIKHQVKSHKKEGTKVQSYVRGNGQKTVKLAKINLKKISDSKGTYWNQKGRYKKEYDLLWAKYVPSMGMHLTDDKKANAAIKALIKASKRYYRHFNDGDPISMAGLNRHHMKTSAGKQRLEEYMDRLILRVWKATNGGKLPVVGYEPDVYSIMSERSKKNATDDWIRRKVMSKKDYEEYRMKENWETASTAYLKSEIALFEKSIANKDKTYDLTYMKKNLPYIKKALKKRRK